MRIIKIKNQIKKAILWLLVLCFWPVGQNVLAQEVVTSNPVSGSGVIREFFVLATINQDGSVKIKEKITYDFESIPGHGIFRLIPVKYTLSSANKEGEEQAQNIQQASNFSSHYDLRIKEITVTKEDGSPEPFVTTKEGNDLKIKIGSPEEMVSGVKTYFIEYRVWRALNLFADRDEFYWNVTGNGWAESILDSKIEIALPATVANGDLRQACYTGVVGSNQSLCLGEVKATDRVVFILNENVDLAPHEGLTVALSWPKGLIIPPSSQTVFLWLLADNWHLIYLCLLPIATFFIFFALWFKRGRDPRGKGTIIARYQPPAGLTPAEAGAIVDEKVNRLEVTSLIVSLAEKGYLKIKEIEPKIKLPIVKLTPKYELIKLKEIDANLKPFEAHFLRSVFKSGQKNQALDLLGPEFPAELENIKEEIYESTVALGCFSRSPKKTRTYFGVLAVAVVASGLLVEVLAERDFLFLAHLISGVIVGFFAWFMPQRTALGVNAKEEILGLKEYINVAEKDRLAFHNAPKKNPTRFFKLLPFAIVLGVEKEWAEQFKSIEIAQPDWYEGAPGTNFSSFYFLNSLSQMERGLDKAIARQVSGGASSGVSGFSSGGGFSGGGFGGGGGGRW